MCFRFGVIQEFILLSCLSEAGKSVVSLEVHPCVQRLDAGAGGVQAGEAVDEVGAERTVHILRGELARHRPVVGPGAPVADHQLQHNIVDKL